MFLYISLLVAAGPVVANRIVCPSAAPAPPTLRRHCRPLRPDCRRSPACRSRRRHAALLRARGCRTSCRWRRAQRISLHAPAMPAARMLGTMPTQCRHKRRARKVGTRASTCPTMTRASDSCRTLCPWGFGACRAVCAGIALASSQASAQQAWPSREVKFVVPFASGTTSDILARAVAEHVAGAIGKPVVIDNRAGAGGNLGAAAAAKGAAGRATRCSSRRPGRRQRTS